MVLWNWFMDKVGFEWLKRYYLFYNMMFRAISMIDNNVMFWRWSITVFWKGRWRSIVFLNKMGFMMNHYFRWRTIMLLNEVRFMMDNWWGSIV